jgi:adenosylcobyric acid synthase
MAVAWLLLGRRWPIPGLGRALVRRGLAVRPFKPRKMSTNAAVTADGGEIGRAQALQARACGVAPSVDMNPVLLKSQSETGAQVVVQGRVLGNYDPRRRRKWRRSGIEYIVSMDAPLVEQPTGDQSPARCRVGEGPRRR